MREVANVVPITMISRLIGFRESNIDLLLTAAFDSTAMLGSTLSLDELMDVIARVGEIQTWLADQLSWAIEAVQMKTSSAPSPAACTTRCSTTPRPSPSCTRC